MTFFPFPFVSVSSPSCLPSCSLAYSVTKLLPIVHEQISTTKDNIKFFHHNDYMYNLLEPLMQTAYWLALTRYLQFQSCYFHQRSLMSHLKCRLHWKNPKPTLSLIWLQQLHNILVKYYFTMQGVVCYHTFNHLVTVTSNMINLLNQ